MTADHVLPARHHCLVSKMRKSLGQTHSPLQGSALKKVKAKDNGLRRKTSKRKVKFLDFFYYCFCSCLLYRQTVDVLSPGHYIVGEPETMKCSLCTGFIVLAVQKEH